MHSNTLSFLIAGLTAFAALSLAAPANGEKHDLEKRSKGPVLDIWESGGVIFERPGPFRGTITTSASSSASPTSTAATDTPATGLTLTVTVTVVTKTEQQPAYAAPTPTQTQTSATNGILSPSYDTLATADHSGNSGYPPAPTAGGTIRYDWQ